LSWDSHTLEGRPLFVWAPADRSRAYPVVYVLHAHLRDARSWFNVEPFERSYPEAIDELAPEAIVALVDGWTDAGGGQWVGEHAAYLCEDVVPFVEHAYAANGLRGLQGKSSGAYGALVNALARPDLFAAVAAHAPMALFEVTVAHDFPAAARELRERGLSLVEALQGIAGLHSAGDVTLAEIGSLALAFSEGELPFRVETAAPVPAVWERWLERDPVRIAAGRPDAVRALRAVWLDAGRRDEYFLDLGAVALRDALLEAGLPQDRLHFELFDGGHRGVSGRYPASLAWLVERLSPATT
jgi:Putative esterase